MVSAVLRRGYRIADRVLRPAMVTVADRADELGPVEDTASDLLRADGAQAHGHDPVGPAERP